MIPFIDLKAQLAGIRADVECRMAQVLDHGKFIMGPEVAELEKELAEFSGAKHCISCSSGTDALLLALMALNIGPGDAVFTTPFTFIATAEAISMTGATPVFVDIDSRTYTLDPLLLDEAIQAVEKQNPELYPLPEQALKATPLKPKAVIPVDLYGLPSGYSKIGEVAEKYGITVLADAAQSFGSEYNGAKAVKAAPIACTSFFPAKPLGCFGDGGAVFTDSRELADACRSLRVHGKGTHKYDNIRTGLNARLDTMQAAVLLAKMKIFPNELENRRKIAEMYSSRFEKIERTTPPHMPKNARSAWAQYTLRSPERAAIQETLQKEGIPSVVYYPAPLHLQTAYKSQGLRPGALPKAEKAAEEVLSLPMHPYLAEGEVRNICKLVSKTLGTNRA